MKKGRDLVPVKQPKKLLIMNILDILRKYSDEEHRLSQKDIAEILKTEYDMTADRKAIRRNILKWANGRTLDLATYMKEHPYMYASDNVRVVFRVAKAMVSNVIDLFGTEVTFSDEDDAGVTVTAFTNEMAMEQFALNFAPDVTVLEPQRLREKVKNALEKALEKYE